QEVESVVFPLVDRDWNQPPEALTQTSVGDGVRQERLTRERIDWLCRDRGELDERARPIWLGRIGVFAPIQPSALTANVLYLDQEILPEFTLDAEVPVLHIGISEVGIHIIRAGIELARTRILDQVPDESFGRRSRYILIDAQRLLVFLDVRNVLDHIFSDDALDSVKKDAVAAADYSFFNWPEGKTETRSEIFLVDRKDRPRELNSRASPTRSLLQTCEREELCRSFGVTAGTTFGINHRRDSVTRVFGRDVQHVTQPDVERQFRTHLPVVLNERRVLGCAQIVSKVADTPAFLPRQPEQEIGEAVARRRKAGQTGPVRDSERELAE